MSPRYNFRTFVARNGAGRCSKGFFNNLPVASSNRLRKGESRGAEPLWRGSGGVPQIQFPPLRGQEGGREMLEGCFISNLPVASSNRRRKGESRGAEPLWRGSEGVPQIQFPPHRGQEGGREMLEGVFSATCQSASSNRLRKGESRGAEPLWRGSGGVPQIQFPPHRGQEGGREMLEEGFSATC